MVAKTTNTQTPNNGTCRQQLAEVLPHLCLSCAIHSLKVSCSPSYRRATAVAEVLNPSGKKPAKKPPPPSSSAVGYSPAKQQPLPPTGVAVLKLLLYPAATAQPQTAAAAGSGAAPVVPEEALAAAGAGGSGFESQRQRHSPTFCVVGRGKASSVLWRMQAEVTPWCDDDSLSVWASRGAVLQQQQQQQAAAGSSGSSNVGDTVAATGGSSGGSPLSLNVNGEEVPSMEAFVQQLIALSQQAQQQEQQQSK